MSTQPKAIYLAEVIEADPLSKSHHDAGAAELRRLHAVNAELLWALKWLCEMHSRFSGGIWDKSRAAIAKAEDV